MGEKAQDASRDKYERCLRSEVQDTRVTADLPGINNIINELTEFFQTDKEEILRKLDMEFFHSDSYVAECWNKANPHSSEEIEKFYRETDAYIYNLSLWNAMYSRYKWTEEIVKKLKKRQCSKVLDFGAGTGDTCLHILRNGFAVDYYDMKGLTSNFASWRFTRAGCSEKINMYYVLEELPKSHYDALICIDVIEHTVNPMDILKSFSGLVRQGGYLFLTESFGCTDDNYPSHLKQNKKYTGHIHKMAAKYGFLCLSSNLYDMPLEFIKLKKDIRFYCKYILFIWKNYLDLFKKGLMHIR